MILILSDRNDSHSNYVAEKISSKKLPYFKLDLDVKSLQSTYITFHNSTWKITQHQKELNLRDVKCVWNRRTFVELLLEEEYDQSNDFKIWKNEWNKALLGIYSFIQNLPWLNPWRNSYRAENKYFQMELANKIGLSIPKTIASNQIKELTDFLSENPDSVIKLMNQDFYKSKAGEYQGFYVNKISIEELEPFKGVGENPIVIQEYIQKDYEVRYTVIGDKHLACKIESQKSRQANIDWRRYDIPNTPHYIIDAPEEIKKKVNILMSYLEIEYGALDFIVNKKGEWIFLEVNSMGQFLWIEDLTGLKISDEIINWLEKHLNL